MSQPYVAVIGGGYSGTIQAIQLLRRGASVTLIEREDQLARGVAYSTPHADHLLNVRANGMSALAGEPDHFADWLGDPDAFAERRRFGRYLQELLSQASTAAGNRLHVVRGEAVDVVAEPGSEIVLLEGGERIGADAAVLAVGNLAPAVPRAIGAELRTSAIFVEDPWAGDFTSGLGEDETLLLIGTGLTAVDAALMLETAGFEGRILALSRRGLVPRAHGSADDAPEIEDVPEPRCTTLIRSVRSAAAKVGWRAAVDQLRPVTQQLWASARPQQRERFLRHLRPYWDVHRHRIAPSIAGRVRNMVAEGRLQFAAGRILSAGLEGNRARVTWRPRGTSLTRTVSAARVVNCTGPEADVARAGEPLLRNLLAAGRVRPHPCRIGFDMDEESRLLRADGVANPSLYAIGPLTRGAWWEVVAVPDIRDQADSVAERIAA